MSARLDAALAELAAAIRDEVRLETASPPPDRLYSIPEAAEFLGIGRSSLYREIGAGRVRSLRVGRRRLVAATAIAERANAE
jgi:excisionase family DNA binding protein